MAPIVTRIDGAGNTILGEGPHWNPVTRVLYFIDINGGTMHKYCPSTNTSFKATIEGHANQSVSLIIPIKNLPNKFIISVDRELGVATWDGKSPTASFERIVEVDSTPAIIDNRINDGKCDASGRIWFGTIGVRDDKTETFAKTASFYSLSDGKTKQHFGDVRISNGLVWNKANTKFYYIDTPTQCVEVFDYDLPTGNITNRKTFSDLRQLGVDGLPDGMTIDTDDNLWVAVFGGSCVLQISGKDGTLMQKVDIPAKQITSVAWGGDNLDELFVTSARLFDPSLKAPVHGAIYKVTNTGCKGFPMNEAVL